jgi:hypothetical protein
MDVNELNLMVSVGDHTFDVRAVDRAGNVKLETLDFSVGMDPDLTITSPSNGHVTRLSKCDFSWEYSGSFNWVRALIRVGNNTQFKDVGGAHNFELDLIRTTRASEEGPYHITLRLEDDHGNHIEKWITVIRDNTLPKVVFDLPEEFPYSNREHLNLTWLGVDQYGIADYWLKIDDGVWETLGTTTYYNMDLEERTYTVSIRANDIAGNVGEYTTSFTIDRTAPVLRITGPHEGDIIEVGEVTFKWELSDPYGISLVNLSVDGSEELEVTDVFKLTRSIMEEGKHFVRIRAVDLCGNIATREVEFFVDLSEPEVEWGADYPSVTNTSEFNLSWSAMDIVGIESVTLTINGEETDFDEMSSSLQLDLMDGEYIVVLIVEDLSGKTTRLELEVLVDSTPPFIDILTEKCSVVDGIAEIIWNIDESGSGLKEGSLMVSIDGAEPELSPLSDRFVTGKLAPGDHVVTIYTQDNAGNVIEDSWEFTVEGKAKETGDDGGSGPLIIIVIITVLLVVGVLVTVFILKKKKSGEEDRKPAVERPTKLTMAIPAPRTSGQDLMTGMKAAPGLPPKKALESSVGNGYIRPDKEKTNGSRPSTISNGNNGDTHKEKVQNEIGADQKETS